MRLPLPRRWKLISFYQEPSFALCHFHFPATVKLSSSSFASASAAVDFVSPGGSTTQHHNLFLEGPWAAQVSRTVDFVFPVSPSFHCDVKKVEGDYLLDHKYDEGCIRELMRSFPVEESSFRLSLLAKCHFMARCGRTGKLKGMLWQLVSKEGLASASSICNTLSHFRGWKGHHLVWDVLVDVYAGHGMTNDAVFALSKMNHHGLKTSMFTYASLVHSLRNTDVVWNVYGAIEAQGLPCSGYILNVLINQLCKQGRVGSAVSFFQDKRARREIVPSIDTFNILIAECCSLGSALLAKAFVSLLIKYGHFPDKYTYSPLIHALYLEGPMQEALALFDDMVKSGLEIDRHICNILIKGFCIHKMMQMVWKVVKLMFMRGLSPDFVTYKILMIGHFQNGNIDEGIRLKRQIHARGFRLTIFTYSVLLNALFKQGLLNDVKQLLQEIEGFNLDLDHMAYSILTHGYCKLEEADRALQIFKVMRMKGFLPNSFNHLTVLLALCKKGRLLQATHYCRSLSACGESVEVIFYNVIIDAYVKSGNFYGSLLLFGEMIKYGITPTVSTFNLLIHGLCNSGNLAEAKALFCSIEHQGFFPNVFTYTTMMDAYGKVDDLDSMTEMLGEMVSKGIMPNVVTYSVIMKKLCNMGRLEEALFILSDMRSKGIVADQITYNTLMDGFIKANNLVMALFIHDEMLKVMQPSPVTYNILFKALSTAHNLWIAEMLMVKLFQKDISLGKAAYTTIIKALCVMGNPCKAVFLFDRMIKMGIKVSLNDFAAVINRLCKKHQMKHVNIIYGMMIHLGIYPDRMLFNCMIDAYSQENNVRSIIILQGKIITSGLALS